jgi:hypothetical protein
MKPEIKDADALLTRLQNGNVPSSCQNLIQIFNDQKQRQIQKLSSNQ